MSTEYLISSKVMESGTNGRTIRFLLCFELTTSFVEFEEVLLLLISSALSAYMKMTNNRDEICRDEVRFC